MKHVTFTSPNNIVESPFQYRRTYNEASLIGMAETMKPPNGSILQAIVVRPNPQTDKHVEYEVVFGHRRLRSALIAGLTEVPIDVRDMTDEEVKRAQLIENIGREDVHPIEEAEGFQRLMHDHGVTADQITADTGKSRTYVYGRLKLLNACQSVRDACLRGEIGSEVALLLARLPGTKVQEHALKAIGNAYLDITDSGAKSYRAIRELLVDKYTLDLATAIFDITDITLLPDKACTSCLDCPDRSGNAPEFADLTQARVGKYKGYGIKGNADICTQPDCFEMKKKAHLQREAAKLEAKGKTVLDGNKAKQAVDSQGRLKDGYISVADAKKMGLTKTSQATLTLTVQDPRTGKTIEAVKRKDMVEAGLLKEDAAKPKSTSTSSNGFKPPRTEEEAAAITEKNKELLKRVIAHVRNQSRTGADLTVIAQRMAWLISSHLEDEILEELNLVSTDHVEVNAADMSVDELAEWLICVVLCFDIEARSWSKETGQARALHIIASTYSVPIDPVEITSTQPTAARAKDKTKGKPKKSAAHARSKSKSELKAATNSEKNQSGCAAEDIDGTGDDAGAVDATDAAEASNSETQI